MKNIYVATKVRGFLLHLFNSDFKDFKFVFNTENIYEVNSKKKLLLSKLVRSRLGDYLGIIKRMNVRNSSAYIYFSYNRFLNSNKNYVILLENPLALVHYSTYRNNTFFGKLKLKKYLNDPNLKAIICLSKACFNTLNYFYSIPKRVKIEQIYPLIPDNVLVTEESIKDKCRRKDINCLYISSKFNLKGGKDILMVFNKLHNLGINNIKLTIITQNNSIDIKSRQIIEKNKNINLFDFKFNKRELNEQYNKSCIFIYPTRQDSFSLVILEAMKSGNAILSTDLYAIPEMVINDFNGYLTFPKYRFFDLNNMPNIEVWNNRKNTIYSNYIDKNVVNFLINKLIYLNDNRDELERLALNSFRKSRTGEFNEKLIIEKWNKVFLECN